VLLLAIIWASSIAQATQISKAGEAALRAAIQDHPVVGISAAISVNQVLVWSGAAGYANREDGELASPDTVYRIASITKPMTAVAMMQLVESGHANLDQPINDLVPSFPQKRWGVTLHHLLSHTSGVRHYSRQREADSTRHYPSLTDAVEVFRGSRLRFRPGSRYLYSTYGYTLVGAAIESASGMKFENYMRERVWMPTGMESTQLEIKGRKIPRTAKGYNVTDSETVDEAPYTDLSVKYPGGGVVSTVKDLLRFAHAFETGVLVSSETRAQMLRPYVVSDGTETSQGLGWKLEQDERLGLFAYTHSGRQAGTNADLIVYPEPAIAIAVISNVSGTRPALIEVEYALFDAVQAARL